VLSSHDVRRTFLDYFVGHGHLRMPSASLIPPAGSSVLYTVAGMQQMTPFFLGHEAAPAPRLTTVQKIFRTVDIEDVGNPRTLTFFEMLGNFSVGDYFKELAIPMAYELLTKGFGLDTADLWYTVHPTDEEAISVWRSVGVPRERIVPLTENWWPDETAPGPNGPDSEIFVDRGERYGCGKPTCAPGCDCDRFLEIWNLVFMQYNRDATGAIHNLPRRNIDTGMGLERMAIVLQNAETTYETDVFAPILERISAISNRPYGGNELTDRSIRIIADHSRSATFLIADGVAPGNTGRGYVLRRVIRRAVRNGKLLGVEDPFIARISDVVVDQLRDVYPELGERQDRVRAVLSDEETRFSVTLASGLRELERLVREARNRGDLTLRGHDLFRLYDSHGLPLEVAQEVSRDEGLQVDEESFTVLLDEQRRRGQQVTLAEKGTIAGDKLSIAFDGLPPTSFLGYEGCSDSATVLRISIDGADRERVTDGQTASVALDRTPFYGLGGGQVPDTGVLTGPDGAVEVTDVQRTNTGVLVHTITVQHGRLSRGDTVRAVVQSTRRAAIARNHTATHLLHAALRNQLGEQVTQAGSVVAPDRLRFDYTYGSPPSPEQLRRVERAINEHVLADLPVLTLQQSLDEARAAGAMALFGEKYGNVVRVVSIDNYSKELCAGTHVPRTGAIGSFIVTGESGIGAGHRRIEAVTGTVAVEQTRGQRDVVEHLSRVLQSPSDRLPEKVQSLLDEQQELRRKLQQTERSALRSTLESLTAEAVHLGDMTYLGTTVQAQSVDQARHLLDALRDRLHHAVIVLAATFDGRASFVVSATPDLLKSGWNAGALAREIGAAAGGSGGGSPQLGQAGVRDAERIPDGLRRGYELVRAGVPPEAQRGRAR